MWIERTNGCLKSTLHCNSLTHFNLVDTESKTIKRICTAAVLLHLARHFMVKVWTIYVLYKRAILLGSNNAAILLNYMRLSK